MSETETETENIQLKIALSTDQGPQCPHNSPNLINENEQDIDRDQEGNAEKELGIKTDKLMRQLLQDDMDELDIIIEVPKHSRIKYEFDKDAQRIVCDRILNTPFTYFFNYGYVPNTLSDDGDPMDAVVLMEDSLIPGCAIRCRILGYLETMDEKGEDPKLVVCPVSKIDASFDGWKDVMDISITILNKLVYFFTHYKDLEPGKYVKVGHFCGKDDAKKKLIDSRVQYYSGLLDVVDESMNA